MYKITVYIIAFEYFQRKSQAEQSQNKVKIKIKNEPHKSLQEPGRAYGALVKFPMQATRSLLQ